MVLRGLANLALRSYFENTLKRLVLDTYADDQRLYGTVIQMFWRGSCAAAFHCPYAEHEALIDLRDFRVIRGSLPAGQWRWYWSGPRNIAMN